LDRAARACAAVNMQTASASASARRPRRCTHKHNPRHAHAYTTPHPSHLAHRPQGMRHSHHRARSARPTSAPPGCLQWTPFPLTTPWHPQLLPMLPSGRLIEPNRTCSTRIATILDAQTRLSPLSTTSADRKNQTTPMGSAAAPAGVACAALLANQYLGGEAEEGGARARARGKRCDRTVQQLRRSGLHIAGAGCAAAQPWGEHWLIVLEAAGNGTLGGRRMRLQSAQVPALWLQHQL
jgi:hypothetical protein